MTDGDRTSRQASVQLASDSISFDLLWICCTTSCTTNPQLIENQQQVSQQVGQLVAQQVHNKSPASCMQQSASLTASRTYNLLYDKSTASRSSGVRRLLTDFLLGLHCFNVRARHEFTRTSFSLVGVEPRYVLPVR